MILSYLQVAPCCLALITNTLYSIKHRVEMSASISLYAALPVSDLPSSLGWKRLNTVAGRAVFEEPWDMFNRLSREFQVTILVDASSLQVELGCLDPLAVAMLDSISAACYGDQIDGLLQMEMGVEDPVKKGGPAQLSRRFKLHELDRSIAEGIIHYRIDCRFRATLPSTGESRGARSQGLFMACQADSPGG